jgi:hypothetical protein
MKKQSTFDQSRGRALSIGMLQVKRRLSKGSSQLDALDDFGDARLFTMVLGDIANATFVNCLLRGNFLLRLVEPLSFLNPRVANALGPVRRETLVGQNGARERARACDAIFDLQVKTAEGKRS